jgi:hypothetical protein
MIPYNDDYCIQSVLRGFVLFCLTVNGVLPEWGATQDKKLVGSAFSG